MQGSKIRSSYISFAKKEKSRLEALVAIKQQEIDSKSKEVAHLKGL
jgi:protein kinase C substrate 80K-H